MNSFDVIILKNGESLSGEVMKETFTIQTSYANLTIEKDKISHIHYENLPQFPSDEVYLNTMDRIKGKLSQSPVSFKIGATGQIVELEDYKIHTIMFLGKQS